MPVLRTLRMCLTLLGSDGRGRLVGLLGLNVIASVFEALSAAAIYAVLGLVVSGSGDATLPVVGSLKDRFPGIESDRLLLYVCVAVGGLFLVRAAVLATQIYVGHRIAYNAGARLSTKLLTLYLDEPWLRHLGTNSAVVMRNTVDSVQTLIANTFNPLIIITAEVVVVSGISAFVLFASPGATIAGAIFTVSVMYVIQRATKPLLTRLGAQVQDASERSYSILQESLQGARDVKLLGREQYFIEAFDQRRAQTARAYYLMTTLSNSPRILIETVFVIGLVGFAAVSGNQDDVSDTITLFGLLGYAMMRILPSVNRIMAALGNLRFGGPALEDLFREVGRMDPIHIAKVKPDPRASLARCNARLPLNDRIELIDVSFHYPGSKKPALDDVSFEVRRGEFLGLAGASGSGKSTLLDVLTGLLSPVAGRVCVDGRDIHDDIRAWQRGIGMVPQTVLLLDGTIRRNVAFGLPDDQIDDEAVLAAIETAQLSDLLTEIPSGLEANVGERGARLSGGQRQRVGIARAIYRQPDVIIFDEGTSALDTITEAEVMAALDAARRGRTVIAVAHRLSTLRAADRIVFLEAGHIVDIGTYDELVATNPIFRAMAS